MRFFMNKIVQRLLVFFIGIPLVISIVAISAYHHLMLHFIMMLCCFLSARELYDLFAVKFHLFPKPFILAISTIPSLTGLFCAIFNMQFHYLEISLIFCFLAILAFEVFTAHTFEYSLDHILTAFFTVFYAGYLMTYVARLTNYNNSTILIATFLFMIFMCDSLAWFFGVLLGKNNRNIIKASPNKSLAGFFGGYIGSILALLIAKFIWPQIFYGSIIKCVFISIFMASAGIIGDLVESVLKRCVNCKDSGKIMPGRGGLLDSIDSIIFASPVFYVIVMLFFSKV